MAKVSCYNRGCGQDFDPENNPDGKWNDFANKVTHIKFYAKPSVSVIFCAIETVTAVHWIENEFSIDIEHIIDWEVMYVTMNVLDFSKHFVVVNNSNAILIVVLFFQIPFFKMRANIIRAHHIFMTRTKDGLAAKRKVSTSPNFWTSKDAKSQNIRTSSRSSPKNPNRKSLKRNRHKRFVNQSSHRHWCDHLLIHR